MHFLFPEFLFALSALAIPVLIHLFNFRRFKKIYFTNVRFLKEIKQDTQSRSRLKHLLILASRLLAIAFLIFAFAQPYFPASKQLISAGNKLVSVYIDNSYSMDALGKNGSLLETARKKAREIASAYRPSDRFQLLTNNFEAKHQRLVNREEFLQQLDDVKSSAAVRSMQEVVARQHDALAENGQQSSAARIYLISDFQKSTADLAEIKSDSTSQISLVPILANKQDNIFIDTCFLSTPYVSINNSNDLVVKIRNLSSAKAENIPLKLTINGVQKALASVSLDENGVSTAHLSFTVNQPGWQEAELSITDYPVTFDDHFYFSFNLHPNLQILSINGSDAGPYLAALFQKDPYFIFRNATSTQVDYSMFRTQQLIVLNEVKEISSGLAQELRQYVSKGGTVFMIPAADMDLNSANYFLESIGANRYGPLSTQAVKVSKLESGHGMFAGVFEKKSSLPENMDLPSILKYYVMQKSSRSREETLLQLENSNAFLNQASFGKGKIFTLAVPLEPEFSNFARHALFVPVLLKAVLEGASEIGAPLIIGRDKNFTFSDSLISSDNVFHLENRALKFDIIPENQLLDNRNILTVHDQVEQAGNYTLAAGGQQLAFESFNFDRKESDLSCYTKSELEELAIKNPGLHMNILDAEKQDLGHELQQLNEGKKLWKACIIFSLLFLCTEMILIRLFNRSRIT